MGMQAVGTYLKMLREQRRMTQAQAAALIGVSVKTLNRWELGRHQARLSSLSHLVTALGGSPDDTGRLMAVDDEAVSSTAARAMVEAKADTDAALLSSDEIAEILAVYDVLKHDPRRLGEWLGYGHRLSVERRAPREDD